MDEVEAGSALIAAPALRDPNFCRTVVLVIDHAEHTEGVITVRGSLALVQLDVDPDLMAPRLRGLRVFAGYSGWRRRAPTCGVLRCAARACRWRCWPPIPPTRW